MMPLARYLLNKHRYRELGDDSIKWKGLEVHFLDAIIQEFQRLQQEEMERKKNKD